MHYRIKVFNNQDKRYNTKHTKNYFIKQKHLVLLFPVQKLGPSKAGTFVHTYKIPDHKVYLWNANSSTFNFIFTTQHFIKFSHQIKTVFFFLDLQIWNIYAWLTERRGLTKTYTLEFLETICKNWNLLKVLKTNLYNYFKISKVKRFMEIK